MPPSPGGRTSRKATMTALYNQTLSIYIFSHDGNEGIFCFDSSSNFFLVLGGPKDVLKNIIPPSFVGEHRTLNTYGSTYLIA